MSNLTTPTTVQAVKNYLARELPGGAYRIEQDIMSRTVVIHERMQRIGLSASLDEHLFVDEANLEFTLTKLIHELRLRAIEHYGLVPELQQARDEGKVEGRKEVLGNIQRKLDNLRDPVTGNIPENAIDLRWLMTTMNAQPVAWPTPSRSSELYEAERRARHNRFSGMTDLPKADPDE